ncbi:hypothetical protein LZ554_008870 [Drepanopeziza brunnea f. sp. 'monogermtubi']|nr:hypothetical protein LZ554_008870 [Drepanopeziza brunnea f. sp. 'monogermtubi']
MSNMSLHNEQQEPRDATDEEVETLRHVVDTIPRGVWIALAVGACERFTFYAVSAPWQNYLQNKPGLAVPGELGLGQATATNIYNAYYFFSFLTPLLFAILSDVWLGRFKTLFLSFFVYVCGCIVLFVTSFSSLTTRETKIKGMACAMVLIGLGTGGVKATISPFIGDQYTHLVPRVITLKSGERVIADRTLTIQYIYNVFYWLTNIASLSLIPSTYLEKLEGFWSAYLLSLCSFWIGVILMVVWRNDFVKLPPEGNVLPNAGKALMYAMRGGFKIDAAKPSVQLEKHGRTVPWSDHFIAELKRGLLACRVMACFALFYLCINQISNNLISQAGQMELGAIPNDAIQAINPIACVLLGPVLQNVLYPGLHKRKIPFGPIARMTTAFVIMAMAMAVAAGIQRLIYDSGPCYERPLECPASGGGKIPNHISVWAQTPIYFILALAEIFGFTTLSEYSYSKAPKDMRSLVQALRQVTAGVGSAFGMALSPVGVNPKILWMYASLAIVMAITSPIFWVVFAKYDGMDKELDDLDRIGQAGDDDAMNPSPVGACDLETKGHIVEEGRTKV